MDLCTVTNKAYINSVLNLIKSYQYNSYNKNIFVYYFNASKEDFGALSIIPNLTLIEVPKNCEHAYEPKGFYYKLFALKDVINRTESFMYSDATNCFISDATNIHKDLESDCLFLPYPYEKLTNQYWTTKKCLDKIPNSFGAFMMPQYWAGFHAYKLNDENRQMISEMHELSKDPEICLPDTSVRFPDGTNNKCIEHRQDQSILSILIHKYGKHQKYDLFKNNKYGDWQTFVDFDKTYKHDIKNVVLSSRESKFGFIGF